MKAIISVHLNQDFRREWSRKCVVVMIMMVTGFLLSVGLLLNFWFSEADIHIVFKRKRQTFEHMCLTLPARLKLALVFFRMCYYGSTAYENQAENGSKTQRTGCCKKVG